MSMAPSLSSELRELYAEESARIQRDFAATGDGRAAVAVVQAAYESAAHGSVMTDVA